MEKSYYEIESCRICGSEALYEFLDFGEMPPTNAFTDDRDACVESYPLTVVHCEACTHVQLGYTVERSLLFDEYPYMSSASDSIPKHFREYAQAVSDRFASPGDLIVDIGSNDGSLLRSFDEDLRTVGIEPAQNIAEVAESNGVETVNRYFSPETARRVVSDYGNPAVVLANNVLGHVDDLHRFMRGVDRLLPEDGVFVLEVPYLVDLIDKVEFDTIFHEHVSYFSITALRTLVEQFDMVIADVERIDTHGGSVRVYVTRDGARGDRPKALEHLERARALDKRETYDWFAREVERCRDAVVRLLDELPHVATVVGYGAPSKGNVLLNYCGIDDDRIEYIVDTTPTKQGTYTPGTGIPVKPPDEFDRDAVDFALMLAWNYRETILEKESEYREAGGHFIVPIPYVEVV